MSGNKHHTRERKLTVTWDDPLMGAENSKTMTGLDYLRAIEQGDIPLPPIARLLGFRLIGIHSGQALFELEPGGHHYNPIGMVHGGPEGRPYPWSALGGFMKHPG